MKILIFQFMIILKLITLSISINAQSNQLNSLINEQNRVYNDFKNGYLPPSNALILFTKIQQKIKRENIYSYINLYSYKAM